MAPRQTKSSALKDVSNTSAAVKSAKKSGAVSSTAKAAKPANTKKARLALMDQAYLVYEDALTTYQRYKKAQSSAGIVKKFRDEAETKWYEYRAAAGAAGQSPPEPDWLNDSKPSTSSLLSSEQTGSKRKRPDAADVARSVKKAKTAETAPSPAEVSCAGTKRKAEGDGSPESAKKPRTEPSAGGRKEVPGQPYAWMPAFRKPSDTPKPPKPKSGPPASSLAKNGDSESEDTDPPKDVKPVDKAGAGQKRSKPSTTKEGKGESKPAPPASSLKKKSGSESEGTDPSKAVEPVDKAGAVKNSRKGSTASQGEGEQKPGPSGSSPEEISGTKSNDTDPSTVARPVEKAGAAGTGHKRPADSQGEGEPAAKRPKGLENYDEACFSNVVLQLLNKALTDEDVQALTAGRGAHPFGGLAPDDSKKPGSKKSAKKMARSRQTTAMLESARESITSAAQTGRLSISGYLGSLLLDMRKDGEDTYTSPLLFQQVFAYGDPEGSDMRKQMDGTEQEDSHLYASAVLAAIQNESAEVVDRFRIMATDVKRCNGCDKKSSKMEASETTMGVFVPDEQVTCNFETLLNDVVEAAAETPADYECEACAKEGTTSMRKVYSNLPANLLVHLNRGQSDGAKTTTPVKLTFDNVMLKGKAYRMTAMVRHKSAGTHCEDNGHYTAFAVHGGQWYAFDDHKVKPVEHEHLADDSKKGQTHMVLLQQV